MNTVLNEKTKLLTLDEWAQQAYTKPPCKATLLKYAENNQIPGAIKQGARWYVITRAS